MSRTCAMLLAPLALLVFVRRAEAGMPTFDLTDAAAARLDTISFFAAGFLLSALGIQRLWNWLREDFTRLPRLSYPKAVGLTLLWALLFVLVLAMISGARELLTPGAWRKEGVIYRLDDPPPDARARIARLEALREALWSYARAHGNQLPTTSSIEGVPEGVWRVLDDPRSPRFVYLNGRHVGEAALVVAYEPAAFGPRRYALLASGEIVLRAAEELAAR